MAPFYGCRDPGTKLDGVKLAPVTAKTSKTGPRHVVRHDAGHLELMGQGKTHGWFALRCTN